jgi:hypothetical protein
VLAVDQKPAPAPSKPAPAPVQSRPAPAPVQSRPAAAPVQAKPAAAAQPKPTPVAAKPASAPAAVAPKPTAAVQSRPTAAQQLNYANKGATERNHVFDGSKQPSTPVTANPGPKPSMVGVPASDFKPQAKVTPSKPPPSPTPVGSAQPSKLNPTGSPEVQKGINNYKRPGT